MPEDLAAVDRDAGPTLTLTLTLTLTQTLTLTHTLTLTLTPTRCAFTGSTATGAKILQASSTTLKPVVLECGGKDPMVVLANEP